MANFTRGAKLWALVAGLVIFAGTAYAGPQVTFGPEEQGMLQIDYKGQFQMKVRDIGSGRNNDETTTSFNFRRNRLAFLGKYGDMVSLYVQTEFTENQNIGTLGVGDAEDDLEFILLDAVMRFNLHDSFKVNVGKFKYNLSRENLEDCVAPLTLDRSLFIRAPFVTTRDRGVAVWGNLFNDMFQYRADVMEGREAVSGSSAPRSSFRYSARAHVTLLDPEKDYGYKGTYLGEKKVLTVGGSYQYEPEVAYGDVANRTGAADYKGWSVDGFLEYPVAGVGTFTASAAYEDIDLEDAFKGAAPDPGVTGLNGEKNGWYLKGGYMLPNLPLQLFGRYEKWSFASLNNIFDQDVDWYGAGANYYIWKQNLKLTFEYSRTDFAQEGTFSGQQGANLTSRDFDTFITQLQLVF